MGYDDRPADDEAYVESLEELGVSNSDVGALNDVVGNAVVASENH